MAGVTRRYANAGNFRKREEGIARGLFGMQGNPVLQSTIYRRMVALAIPAQATPEGYIDPDIFTKCRELDGDLSGKRGQYLRPEDALLKELTSLSIEPLTTP